jgi:hypothetical protein
MGQIVMKHLSAVRRRCLGRCRLGRCHRGSGRARDVDGQPFPADLVGQAVRLRGVPQVSLQGAAVPKCNGVAYCSKDCQVCSPPHPACALSRPQSFPSAPLLLTRVFVTCSSLCTLPLSLRLAPSHCSLTPYNHSSFTPALIQTRTNSPSVAFQTRRGRPGTRASARPLLVLAGQPMADQTRLLKILQQLAVAVD